MNRKIISGSNYVLREVLNSEENKDIIQDIIETILNIKIDQINIIKELKYHEIFKQRLGIVEVEVITDQKEKFLVGIQIIDGYYANNKMVLYHTQLLSNQEYFKNIIKTITINILDDKLYNTINYKQVIKLKEETNTENLGEIHLLELPKFTKKEIKTKEEEWISYLKGENKEPTYEKIKKLDEVLDKYWKDEVL